MFVVVIIAAILTALGTIGTRLVGRPVDRLKAQRDAAQQAELQQQLTDARQQLVEQRAQEAAAREYRRTAPIVQVALAAEAPYKFFVQIVSENLIPFECNYMVTTKGNLSLTGVPIERAKAFPTEGNREFSSAISVDPQRIQDRYLELRFELWSLAPEFHALPGHYQTIIKKYTVAANGGLRPAE